MTSYRLDERFDQCSNVLQFDIIALELGPIVIRCDFIEAA